MLKSRFSCAIIMVSLMATGLFAAFPTGWSDIGLNADRTLNGNYSAVISDPNITLSETTPVTLGGSQIIAAWGTPISYTDTLLVSSDISRNGGNSDCGLLLNYNSGTMSGYLLTVGFLSGYIDIFRLDNGVNTEIIKTPIPDFNADTTYYVEFAYKDGHLTGNIYDESDILKASISGDDSAYTSGSVGVLASTTFGSSGAADSTRAYFADYDVADVPEPMTLTLLTIGAAGLVARRKRS